MYKDKRANVIVERAIKDGSLKPREKCEQCGRSENALRRRRTIWAHHDDYSLPLVVRWLCPSCHMNWHKRNAPAPNLFPVRVAKQLSVEQIEEIRYLHGLGLSDAFIAQNVGCGRTTVWRIVKREREGKRVKWWL